MTDVSGRRVAVVLFNLGGPDRPESVKPFLFNLFNDPAIIGLPWPARTWLAQLISSRREKEAQANYDIMGGGSPLLPETEAQALALETVLAARGLTVKVFIAMRYWRPLTADTARAVAEWKADEVVLLPLYPQFSTTTTGSSLKEWGKHYGEGDSRSTRTVCCYPELEGFVEAHARCIETAWRAAGAPEKVRLLFSAHGLPEKVIAGGDPYQAQVEATAAAVAARLSGLIPDWSVCYQSRVGPLKWIGPATPDAIRQAVADGKGVVISPIAFVSEHVETLVELDHEYAEFAEEVGCAPYVRVPALGVEPAFIDGLADVVTDALGRDGVQSACGGRWCDAKWRRCPRRGVAGARGKAA